MRALLCLDSISGSDLMYVLGYRSRLMSEELGYVGIPAFVLPDAALISDESM